MVYNFGAKNFFCFKEGINISFELGKNCPKSISVGKSLANAICVKGANASGKTNALKIIPILTQFCKDSFSLKPDNEIMVETFFNNNEPAELFIEFSVKSVKFRYELSITKKHVVFEKLYRIISRESLIIHREGNKFLTCIEEFKDLETIKLRSNASFISTAHQYEIESIDYIYSFFSNIVSKVNYFGLVEKKLDLSTVSQFYKENPDTFAFVKKLIRECDMGVEDIKIEKKEDLEGEKVYYPVFYHRVEQINYKLLFYNQSSGTKSLYLDLVLYWIALHAGCILILDEFDINYHPHMLPKLVNLFTSDEYNEKNAQLIFTSHNSDIMDIMGKYRTVLINKKENESFGYRLDEIPGDIIRNDRSIVPAYNSGKIGGIPKI